MQPDPTSPLDLDRVTSRAGAAYQWLLADQRERTGSDWLPLSVREHFTHDIPALLAALAEAQRELRAAMDLLAAAWTDRDAALADAERMRGELTDAGWSSVADLHAAYVDVLERWQRSEPVVAAAREIVFDWWKQVAAGETFDDDVLPLEAALVAAVDTYETQEGTDG